MKTFYVRIRTVFGHEITEIIDAASSEVARRIASAKGQVLDVQEA